jgi:hypothetical protein
MIKLCSVENDSAVIELRVALSGSMLEVEERAWFKKECFGVIQALGLLAHEQ